MSAQFCLIVKQCKETGTTSREFQTKAGNMTLNEDNANAGRDLDIQKIAFQSKCKRELYSTGGH